MTDAAAGRLTGAGTGPARPSATATRSTARPGGGARRPAHVAVALGLTTGLYAAALAGVTALEAAAEARLAADRAPAAAALASLRAGHDALEARISQLGAAYASASDRYQAIAGAIAAHERALGALAADVRSASGSAAALSVPSVRLPVVSGMAPAAPGKPMVNACTTASGKPC